MSADVQEEYPFDLSFTTSSSMSFAELDLSQSAFLNPGLGQLPWSESKSNGNPAIDSQLFTSQPQPHAQPQQRPSAENEIEMEGDIDLHYPNCSPSPHVSALPRPAATPIFVQPSEVRSPSPPAFGVPVPFPRVPGSSSPPGLTGESDEDLGCESGDCEDAYPSDGAVSDDDGEFMPSRMMSRSRTRSRRTSSVSVSGGGGSVHAPRPCRLSAPVPVPNLTKSRGRRVPTAPVIIVQGGVQKNMRMYRCTVDGCYKCFARGEHLKRHVRSIHTAEKRECCFPPSFGSGNFDFLPLQHISVP
jgi:hypothetical protein